MESEQQALDKPERPSKLWGIRMVALAIPVIAVVGFFFLAPVFGYAAIADYWRVSAAPEPDPETAIPVASVLYMVVVLALLAGFVVWLVRGRRPFGFFQTYAVMAVILGALTAFQVAIKGAEDSVENWELWIIPIAGAAVLGAVFSLILLVVRLKKAASAEATAEREGLHH